MKFIIFFLVFIRAPFAQERPTNGRLNYVFKSGKMPIQMASEMILRDLPLATSTTILQKIPEGIDNGEFYRTQEKYFKEVKKVTEKKTKEIIKSPPSLKGESKTGVILTKKTAANISNFHSCIKKMRSLYLKHTTIKHNNRIGLITKKSILKELEMLINSSRGLNGQQTTTGIICGKFLGALAFPRLSEIEEIKILLSISKLNKENTIRFLEMLISIFHRDSPTIARQIIAFFKRYQMLRIAFDGKREVLDLEELKRLHFEILKEEERENIDFKHGSIRQKTADLWPHVEKSLQWSRSRIKEVL